MGIVVASPEFHGAERLQAFLTYVVEESLAGRGERIRAKTIVEDVYERSPGKGRDPMAVVRVDAGRLRRRLKDYYNGSGAGSTLQIHIDAGGYAPRFEHLDPFEHELPHAAPPSADTQLRRVLVVAGGIAALFALGWFVVGQTFNSARLTKDERRADDVREALFNTSPAKLQAANLAEQSRALLFPALDPERLTLVLALFKRAIELDPDYFGGYAGSAQTLATLAITSPPGPHREELEARAAQRAERALELGPAEGWSHSASALVAMAGKNYDAALAQSSRALVLSPEDVWVRNVDALIALFSGEFERAIQSAEIDGQQASIGDRFPHRNVIASAKFHLGHYGEAIKWYNEAAREGDPISAISVAYLAAAQQRLGETEAAVGMLELMEKAWPGFPIETLFLSLFRDKGHALEITSALEEAASAHRSPAPPR
ncbi:tetratricopeptide repeat protein [Tropicimonas marinistellae]|uniref:tetratricopeptide repeat protein n=1 Tax=Tropicimonas marinistellae TaxID=1739787 RepID=UPI00082C0F0E|nr:tetratricopeptide repeat protein [Tropicimonas marinistellae]